MTFWLVTFGCNDEKRKNHETLVFTGLFGFLGDKIAFIFVTKNVGRNGKERS